jgi:hypothetical protein
LTAAPHGHRSPLPGERDRQDVKALDTLKVPGIGCSYAPSCGDGDRGDEPMVRPDVLAGGGEFGPDAGVRTSGQQAERQRGKRDQHSLDEGLTTGSVLRRRAVDAMQQLRGCNGGYADLLVRAQLLFQLSAYLGHGGRALQAPDGSFKVDEDGGV